MLCLEFACNSSFQGHNLTRSPNRTSVTSYGTFFLIVPFFTQGLLGEKQLATQIMILSAYGIVFQFSLSIGIGAGVRVGNHLGAGKPEGARKAAWCGVKMAFVAATTAALGLGFGRGQWPRLYDVSEEVLEKIIDLTPIYVGAQVNLLSFSLCFIYVFEVRVL